MRIYLGGIGPSVTMEDIEKTFSPMGGVSNIEIVTRPDGCGFAFMDFEPNSDKSIARLFANYNGCIWKGSKLKLEKASEHYMDRLKREWKETAEIAESIHVDHTILLKTECVRVSKFAPDEKKQLKIFFPKLRKVKSLPFKGTGKHKYSFQRVNIPPLPVHFCDCDEHSQFCDEANNTTAASAVNLNGLVSDKELNLMHSVMNKLFTKEVHENYGVENEVGEMPLPPSDDERNADIDDDDQLNIEQEVQEADDQNGDDGDDDENLIMNIGSRGNSATLDFILEGKKNELALVMDKKRTASEKIGEMKSSVKRKKTKIGVGNGTVVSMVDSQLKNASTAELPKFPSVEPGESKPPSPQLLENPEPQPTTAQIKENPVGRGASWVQKSSWRDLLGNSSSSSFSISHVLPGTGMMKPDVSGSQDSSLAGIDKISKVTETKTHGVPFSVPEGGQTICETEPLLQPREEGVFQKDDLRTTKTKSDVIEEKTDKNVHTGTSTPMTLSNACTFMRTSDSQQQWSKAKSAMSRYLKKKQTAKSSSANISVERTRKHRN